jgi:hypothetical protein
VKQQSQIQIPRFAKRIARLSNETDRKLEALSLRLGVSTNSILEKAVRRYVEWEVFAEGVGLVQVPPSLYKTLMNHLTDEEARNIGKQSGNDASIEFIRGYFHKFDLESLLESFRVIGDEFMHAFKYNEFSENPQRTIMLRHNAGPRVSAYYSEVLKALCSQLNIGVEVHESETQITATIGKHDLKP